MKFGLSTIVQAVRDWMCFHNLRCLHHSGLRPVKIQLIFTSDTDAWEAVRAFQHSEEAFMLRESGERIECGIGHAPGRFNIDGMIVEMVGPELKILR